MPTVPSPIPRTNGCSSWAAHIGSAARRSSVENDSIRGRLRADASERPGRAYTGRRTTEPPEATSMSTTSPARVYALAVGVVLVAAGVIGFFYESAFTSDESVRGAVLGLLDVNGWHNVVHIATGALGILAARMLASARTYCLAFGIVYLLVCVWGFVVGNDGSVLGIVPVNNADNVLHLLLTAGGFAAYAASAPAREARAARPAMS